MGDTGSLGLGGAIAGLAVMTKTEVLLILLGGIFVIEALSVVIQVISFQTTRKRVFLMAPIHHHFELKAWSETKIILRFWIVASICARDRLHDLPPEPGRLSARARLEGFRGAGVEVSMDASSRSTAGPSAGGARQARAEATARAHGRGGGRGRSRSSTASC